MYNIFIKRFLDLTISLIALIVFSPVLLILFILLILANQGNPFFYQDRPGKDEKVFKVIKFKTMTDKQDEYGNLLPDSVRLTKTGKLLRSTSLDELPQLFNVIKGEMAIIGPRPLLVQYLPFYNESQNRRHDVRPGITGWAQVNGRNAISWQQKFEYDVWYVEHLTFWLDIKILFMTIHKVFKSEGIDFESNTTSNPFTGN